MIRFSQEPLLNHTFYRAKENIKVEILKFSEPPKRSSRSNTRKKGGVMPLLSVVAAVALVGGMSSTLAGTITLNSNTGVEFGQGIVTAAACDTSIKLTPTSAYETDTAKASTNFVVSSLKIENLGLATGGSDGAGCKGKFITVKAYAANESTPLTWNTAKNQTEIKFQLPDSDTLTAGTQITKVSNSSDVVIADGGISGSSNAVTSSSVNQYFTLSNLYILSTVVRFTVESSDS